METVAKKFIHASEAKGEEPAFSFFAAKSSDGAVPQIRKLCGLPEDVQGQPLMLLLDLDDNGAFYMSEQPEVTAATIEAFTKSYEQKKLTRRQIQKRASELFESFPVTDIKTSAGSEVRTYIPLKELGRGSAGSTWIKLQVPLARLPCPSSSMAPR